MAAAQAVDSPWATKFAETTAMPMVADQPASGSARTAPTANASAPAGRANGAMWRISSRSGSTVATVSPSVSEPYQVGRAGRAEDRADREEDAIGADQSVGQVPEAAPGGDAPDHRRRDRPPG